MAVPQRKLAQGNPRQRDDPPGIDRTDLLVGYVKQPGLAIKRSGPVERCDDRAVPRQDHQIGDHESTIAIVIGNEIGT